VVSGGVGRTGAGSAKHGDSVELLIPGVCGDLWPITDWPASSRGVGPSLAH
jgi:hypothetical protein